MLPNNSGGLSNRLKLARRAVAGIGAGDHSETTTNRSQIRSRHHPDGSAQWNSVREQGLAFSTLGDY